MTGRRAELLTLALIVAVAAGLRLYRIDQLSLWNDEGFTWWAISHGFGEIWHVIPTFDSHPPLFYTLVKLWTLAFGTGEAGLRGLSALAGVATVPVLWQAGRIVHGPSVGLLAAALFALAPVQLQYGQEARPYALLTLAAAIVLTGTLWLVRHPEAARQPVLGRSGREARPAWLALALGSALALWLHNLGILAPGALGLAGLLWLGRDRQALRNLVLVGVLVLLLWAPFALRFLAQSEQLAGVLWIAPPDGARILAALRFLFSVRFLEQPPSLWPLLALAGLGLAALVRRGAGGAVLVLGTAILAPILVSLLVSVTVRPIFLDRTLLWTSLPFYLALASVLLLVPRRRWMQAAVAACLVLLFAVGSFRYYQDFRKEPWRRLVQEVAAGWQPGDLLVLVPDFLRTVTDYYAARQEQPLRLLPLPLAEDKAGFGALEAETDAARGVHERDVEALRQALRPEDRAWLILRRADLYDREGRVRALLEGQGRPLLREERVYGRSLWLYLYGAAPPDGS